MQIRRVTGAVIRPESLDEEVQMSKSPSIENFDRSAQSQARYFVLSCSTSMYVYMVHKHQSAAGSTYASLSRTKNLWSMIDTKYGENKWLEPWKRSRWVESELQNSMETMFATVHIILDDIFIRVKTTSSAAGVLPSLDATKYIRIKNDKNVQIGQGGCSQG